MTQQRDDLVEIIKVIEKAIDSDNGYCEMSVEFENHLADKILEGYVSKGEDWTEEQIKEAGYVRKSSIKICPKCIAGHGMNTGKCSCKGKGFMINEQK